MLIKVHMLKMFALGLKDVWDCFMPVNEYGSNTNSFHRNDCGPGL